jgi:hypothetical protein
MTKGIKALNNRGEITLCTAKNPGTGNCNHVLHQFEGMSDSEFQSQVDDYNEKLAKAEEYLSHVNISDDDKEDIREMGVCEIYTACGGSEKNFNNACINVIYDDDKVFVTDSKKDLHKQLYSYYFDKIEDAIVTKLDNGEDCDYGYVKEHSGGYDTPDDVEYATDFSVNDIEYILEDDSIIEGMDLNIIKGKDGKYYAINIG